LPSSPVSLPLAFLAGLLSFLSPCVLPLAPAYLSYLSGSSLYGEVPPSRRQVLTHALLFVAGFTLILIVVLGLPTTLLGGSLVRYGEWIARIGGAVLVLFGLHSLGVLTLPGLDVTRRFEVARQAEPGYIRSALIGVSFAAGWTPCIGPLLGTVMTLAFTQPSRAIWYLFAYSLGLSIPFLVMASLFTQAISWLRRVNRHARTVKAISGLLMVGVGIMLVSGMFSALSSLLARITPAWLFERI